ncbi:MAG TPA: universal stress protein [Thermoanaerobaculia bacterium]|nr:universal stress protein [Thermoanaerobaculia bacterium]
MSLWRRFLVHVDADSRRRDVVRAASELAVDSGAAVKLVDVVDAPGWHHLTSRRRSLEGGVLSVAAEQKRERLSALAEPLRAAGLEVSVEILVGSPWPAVLKEVGKRGHDLVMLAARRQRGLRQVVLGGTAHHLVRHAPCPVYIVHPGHPRRPRRILVAVDPGDEDVSRERAAKLVRVALELAALSGARVDVVHAWRPFAERIVRHRVSQDDLRAYVEETRRRAVVELRSLLAPFADRFEPRAARLIKGDPVTVVPALSAELGSDLLVLGTVARTGIAGVLIGNTAEEILDRIACSVLVVKPDGFVSPLRLED